MNKRLITGIITATACGYLLWHYLTPVEIVAVHDGNTLLVKHFPFFKSQQIAWWESNKSLIKKKYGIPHKDRNGYYTVYILDFGEGYRREQGTDGDANLLCFDDMTVMARCIDKRPLMSLGSAPNAVMYYD
ncbi:DUF943 family protein [Enterobacter sp. Bisph1]|uniref:DUF943 family protein n=1 Tax=Enterobacter sp. Bisph1 TaxID=1274399 RepID=UPI00057C05C3|nr:DUF943 family protein [Enterobacter sp. Bisph1]